MIAIFYHFVNKKICSLDKKKLLSQAESENTKLKTYNNTKIRHIGTCYILHREKQKTCRFLVVPVSGPAMLGMPDIETLGLLTKDDKTIGRQLTLGYNANKRQELPV